MASTKISALPLATSVGEGDLVLGSHADRGTMIPVLSTVSDFGVVPGELLHYLAAPLTAPPAALKLTGAPQVLSGGVHPALDAALGLTTVPPIYGPFSEADAEFLEVTGLTAEAFGYCVVVSGDGMTMAIGSPNASTVKGSSSGFITIFENQDGQWGLTARFQPAEAVTNQNFGFCASLSHDGSVLLVGAPYAPFSGRNGAGLAYSYSKVGGVWSEEHRLTPSEIGEQANFGTSLMLSADGNVAIVSAMNATSKGVANAGAVYVFERTGLAWEEKARLSASTAKEYANFGMSVGLSRDAKRIVIGAPYEDNGYSFGGAAYVFDLVNGSWVEAARLLPTYKAQGAYFGTAVAISGAGKLIAVGAPRASTENGQNSGTVNIFEIANAVWSEKTYIVGPVSSSSNSNLGSSVAIDAEGTTIVAGAPGARLANYPGACGCVITITIQNARWTRDSVYQSKEPGEGDSFGRSVSISAVKGLLLVGASSDDKFVVNGGSAEFIEAPLLQPATAQLNIPAAPDNVGVWYIATA